MTTNIFSPVQQKMLFNQIKESNFFNSLIITDALILK